MEQHDTHRGGETQRTLELPHWPKYIGALALDAWLARVAAYDTPEPSVELCIAQYPENEIELAARPSHGDGFQLPLHLQWGDLSVPENLCERPLSRDDAEATRRLLAVSVDIFAGRTALFALYGQLADKVYAATETRLRTGTRLPSRAELRAIHGQYATNGVIEACGVAASGGTARALVARLERRRRRWVGTVLRLV